MSIVSVATIVFLSLVLIGAFLGFVRGWKKSLVRSVILICALIASMIIAPMISSMFIGSNGSVFELFSININLEDLLGQISQDLQIDELLNNNSITNKVIVSILNIISNLILFVVVFLAIEIISLIVYWIVCFVMKIKTRSDRSEEKEDEEDNKQLIGLKILSVIFGIIGSLTISFVLLTPVFGVMNICDNFIAESESQNSANASNLNSFVCGELYYTEDKNIGKIEEYIQKYANLKNSYNKSFVGKFMNMTGLSKAGAKVFETLTTVKHGGFTLNLTNEVVQISQAYNVYKDVFVKNKFEFTDNKDLDGLVKLYDEAIESEIGKGYVVEIVPQISDKWSSGEKFIGIKNPISGNWKETVNASLLVFKVDSSTRITNNFKALAKALKLANNHEVIDRINRGDDVDVIILESDNFIRDEILILVSTSELRENLPNILNEAFEALYFDIVGIDQEFENNDMTFDQIHSISSSNGWNEEADNIQLAMNEVFKIYQQVKVDSSNEALSDELENFGLSIDYARKSKLISKPFKTFITGFIEEKTNIKQSVKDSMLNTIKTKWDVEDVNFAKTFKALEATAKIADNMTESENVSFSELAPTLESIADDTATKETLADMIDSGIVDEFIDENSSAEVVTQVLDKFVSSDKVDGTTVQGDIDAGEQIVNVVNNADKNGNLGLGTTEEERNAKADEIIGNLTKSEAMLELLDEENQKGESSAISSKTQKISSDDKLTMKGRIEALELDPEQERILKATFGIV